MDVCIGKSKVMSRKPVAYLTCNGSPPVAGQPSLMTFREVETLFHEFGHGLQHMLTRVEHGEAAGSSSSYIIHFSFYRQCSRTFVTYCMYSQLTMWSGMPLSCHRSLWKTGATTSQRCMALQNTSRPESLYQTSCSRR